MAIHVEQGIGASLGEDVASIAGAVQGLVQPYKRIEQVLRAAIAEDPSLAQKLTDMEFKTPGSTAALFGKNAGQYFGSLRPSNEAIIQKTITPYVEKALKNPDIAKYVGAKEVVGVSPGTVEEDKYKGEIAKATVEALKSPELLQAAVTKKATGGGVGTLSRQAFEARSIGVLNGILAKDSPDIMIDKVLNNQYTPSELNAIFTAPSLSKALDMQLRAKLAAQRDALARQLQAARLANDRVKMADLTTRLQVADALLQARTTGKSTPAAFLRLGGAPDSLVEAFGGTSDEQLAEAQEAQDIAARQFAEKGAITARKGITAAMGIYFKAVESEQSPAAIAAIVKNIQDMGAASGFNVLYDEKNGLRVLDPAGNIVDPSAEVTSVGPVTGKRTTTPNLPPHAGSTVTQTTERGGGSAGFSTRTVVPVPREKGTTVNVGGGKVEVAPPKAAKLSNNSQIMLAQLESMRAGKDPRTRAKIEAEFAAGLKKKAETSKEAKAIYDELKAHGHIK